MDAEQNFHNYFTEPRQCERADSPGRNAAATFQRKQPDIRFVESHTGVALRRLTCMPRENGQSQPSDSVDSPMRIALYSC